MSKRYRLAGGHKQTEPDRDRNKMRKVKSMGRSLLLVGGLLAASINNASATLAADAETAIEGMVTEVGGVGTAIILLAAAIGTIGVVKGLVRRH